MPFPSREERAVIRQYAGRCIHPTAAFYVAPISGLKFLARLAARMWRLVETSVLTVVCLILFVLFLISYVGIALFGQWHSAMNPVVQAILDALHIWWAPDKYF